MTSSEANSGSRTISAVELVGAGGYDKLRIKKFPCRALNENEVCIRVKFAGLNFADLMRRYDFNFC